MSSAFVISERPGGQPSGPARRARPWSCPRDSTHEPGSAVSGRASPDRVMLAEQESEHCAECSSDEKKSHPNPPCQRGVPGKPSLNGRQRAGEILVSERRDRAVFVRTVIGQTSTAWTRVR